MRSYLPLKMTVALLLLSVAVTAQYNTINGRLLDSASRSAVSLATIRLVSSKGTVVQSGISDSTGCYYLRIPAAGSYHLQFSHASYAPRRSQTFTITISISMADHFLSPLSKELGSVTVTGVRTLIIPRIDGFLYNARDDIPVAGEKAADVLRKLPGVMVNPEGNPAINGSGRVKVFIDGKPSETFALTVADALKQVAAENIATIEVISHPSAKYEAEGVSGVITITTKQPLQNATSGTLTTTVANRSLNVGGNLLLKRNKWIIGIDAGLNKLNLNTAVSIARYGLGPLAGNNTQQERFSLIRRNNEYAGMTFTYSTDSVTTYFVGYRIARYHDDFRHQYDNTIQSAGNTDAFIRIADNPLRRWMHSVNAGYNKKSKNKKTEFSLLVAGFYRRANDRYRLIQHENQVETYQEINSNTSLIREITLQADYSRELKNKTRIETGGRFNHRNLVNNNHFDVFDYNAALFSKDRLRSGKFGFKSSISALYISYSFNIRSYRLRAGMRYEHTAMKLSANDSSLAIPLYGNLLPNFLISKSFKSWHTLSASYAMRIQRPYMVYLSPVVNYMDSLNIEYGNPVLKPIIIHNFLLTHTFIKNRVTLNSSVFINRSVDNIEYVRTLKPNGVTESSWFNISNNTVYGATFNFGWQGKSFSFRINNTLQTVFFNTDGTFPGKKAMTFSNGGYFSYKFKKGYTLTSYTSFNTRSISLQGYATGVQWYNFILSKSYLEGKLNVALRIDNISTRYQYITEKISTPDFYQEMKTRNIYRFFRFNLSYRIGKKEVKPPSQRTISNEQ